MREFHLVGENLSKSRTLRAQLFRHEDQEEHCRPGHRAPIPLPGLWVHGGPTGLHLWAQILHVEPARH